MRSILLLLLAASIASAIFAPGASGGFGGGGFGSRSSSSSSEEGRGHHGHGHGHHHGRPPRPRPPRPPVSREPECPSDWLSFDRPQGVWCVKVFYESLTQPIAESRCQAQGATLSGYQNANERMQVSYAARTLTNQNGGGLAEVWVGAYRKARCPNKPSCTPLDTFEWTDGHTTGTDGFHYPGTEPNGYVNEHGQQYCMEMHIHPSSDTEAARYGYHQGDLDDMLCVVPVRLYACGKVPEQV